MAKVDSAASSDLSLDFSIETDHRCNLHYTHFPSLHAKKSERQVAKMTDSRDFGLSSHEYLPGSHDRLQTRMTADTQVQDFVQYLLRERVLIT